MRSIVFAVASVLLLNALAVAQPATFVRQGRQDRAGVAHSGPIALPAEFDWRDQDGHFWMTPIRDQGGCHSSFVYAVIGALEADIKIQANNPWLMPDFCEQDSIPEWRIDASGWTAAEVDSIKAAILKGAVVGRLIVYDDFFAYPGGIYEHQWGDWAEEHYVVLLGWSDADSCWICKNSWGPGWGEEGWFRIKYGQCGIEDDGSHYLKPVSWGRDGAVIREVNYQYELQAGSVIIDTLLISNTFPADSMFFGYEITSYPPWITPATLSDTLFGEETLGVEFEVNSTGLEGSYLDTMMVAITDAQAPEPELHAVQVVLDVRQTYRVEDERRDRPEVFSLEQNYPNPFNDDTTIRYHLCSNEHVTLKVYNISGQEVATLVDDDRSAGTYLVRWRAAGASSGLYIYRLMTGEFGETRKMVLMK
jgi:hypothetical protein